MDQPKCKDRIREHYRERIKDLRRLWKLYQEGNDEGDPDIGTFHEYGLSFDYCPAGTFGDQKEGFFRYQISWGGPAEEFRFYTDGALALTRIRFYFLDWWDGAYKTLTGRDYDLLAEIFEFFRDIGSVESELMKAEAE
jgi:hypothetical protein